MPKIKSISARNHNIIVNMVTGEYTVEHRKLPNLVAPEYDSDCATFETSNSIHEMFRLSGCVEEMKRHLYELLGFMLLNNNDDTRYVISGSKISSSVICCMCETIGINQRKGFTTIGAPSHQSIIENDFKMHKTHVVSVGVIGSSHWQNLGFVALEQGGIFRKSIDGLSRLIRRGHFDTPKPCISAHKEFFKNADQIGNFIESRMITIDLESVRVPANDVYFEYLKYCGDSQHVGKKEFSKELKSRGIPMVVNRTGVREYWGLSFKIA